MACYVLRLIEIFAPFLMRWQFNKFFVLQVTFHKLLQVTDLVKALCIVHINSFTNQIFQARLYILPTWYLVQGHPFKTRTLSLFLFICTGTPNISHRGLQLRKENCYIHFHILLLFFQLKNLLTVKDIKFSQAPYEPAPNFLTLLQRNCFLSQPLEYVHETQALVSAYAKGITRSFHSQRTV